MLEIIDIHWIYKKEKYSQELSLLEGDVTSHRLHINEIKNIPLKGYNFNFQLSSDRYCVGYYEDREYIPCQSGNVLESISFTQCRQCEQKHGFREAFLFKGHVNENMKKYLSQTHYIYLAIFGDNRIKVGTTLRKDIRPIEQDALIYCYIAENEGYRIQDLEHYISTHFGIPEYMNSRMKLKFTTQKLNSDLSKETLKSNYRKIFDKLNSHEEFGSWLYQPSEIDIVDLTHNPEIYYPEIEEKLKITYLDKVGYALSGEFRGIRGRYLFLENNNKIFCFDSRDVLGRMIEGYVDEGFRYQVEGVSQKQDDRLGLF